MNKNAIANCLASCLLISLLVAGTAVAEQSKLLRSFLRYQRNLTLPTDTPDQQRTLLAVIAAATETKTTDPGELQAAYHQAKGLITYTKLSDTSFTWTGAAWQANSRTAYTYNSNYQETSETSQMWNTVTWENSSRQLQTYDASNRLDSARSQEWNVSDWRNTMKTTYSYDGSSNMIGILMQDWDTLSAGWVNSARSTMTYSSGRPLTSTMEQWDTDSVKWINSMKLTYSYDGGGHLAVLLSQMWDGSTWMDYSRTSYTYDGSGRDTLSVTERKTTGWTNFSKNQSSYNGATTDKTLNVLWTWSGSSWSKTMADTLKYDITPRLTEIVHYVVSGSLLSRSRYSYDVHGNEIQVISEQNYGGFWMNSTKIVSVYQFGVAVRMENDPLPSNFELAQNYPNPFNPTTVIRYSLARRSQVEIAVYNVLGQEVITLENSVQTAGAYETTWDGTDRQGQAVASGIYFYRIKAGDFSETRKMMLLK